MKAAAPAPAWYVLCYENRVMDHLPDDISIHAKKFYRVILEGIDESAETPGSFALKLSTRTRVSLPRVMSVVGRLPCVVKSHLTAAQANRLKNLLEEIGGGVRVEAHVVTPTGAGSLADQRDGSAGSPGRSVVEEGKIVCPDCGWEAEIGATHCSLCLRKFRDAASRPKSLEDRVPEKNPLDTDWDPTPPPPRTRWGGSSPYLLVVILGILAALVVVVLTK